MKIVLRSFLSAIRRLAFGVGCWAFAATAAFPQEIRVPSDPLQIRQRARPDRPASSTEFRRYIGEQPEMKLTCCPDILKGFAVPVYLWKADKPYIVIGAVGEHWAPANHKPREAALKSLAAAAKAHGADAVIIEPLPPLLGMKMYVLGKAVKWSGK